MWSLTKCWTPLGKSCLALSVYRYNLYMDHNNCLRKLLAQYALFWLKVVFENEANHCDH